MLANLNFAETQITVFGTQQEPLIKCTDLIRKVLGYRDTSQAKWFSDMKTNIDYVTTLQNGVSQQMAFTEMGIYKALMKSNKPIAEQFQKQVCDLLKSIRLQTIKQLEESQKQLQEAKQQYLNSKKVGFIYGLRHKRYKSIDYVGFTESSIEDRVDSHFSQLIAQMKIPFYKCLIAQMMHNYEIVELERIEYYEQRELRDRETYWQLFHQSIQESKKMKCKKCQREYVQAKSFEKHRLQCYGSVQQSGPE